MATEEKTKRKTDAAAEVVEKEKKTGKAPAKSTKTAKTAKTGAAAKKEKVEKAKPAKTGKTTKAAAKAGPAKTEPPKAEPKAENNSGDNTDDLSVAFTIEIPRSEIDGNFEQALLNYIPKIEMPGFRKGKVPIEIVRSRFKESIIEEVVHEAIQKAVMEKIEKDNLKVISEPELLNVDYGDGKNVTAEVRVNVFPTVTLPDFDTLEVEIPASELELQPFEEEKQIDALLEGNRRQVPVVSREIRDGDQVMIKFQSKILRTKRMTPRKSVSFNVEKEGNSEILDLYQDIVGKKLEDEFTISRTYPDDYRKKPWAGEEVEHYLMIESIFEMQKPEFGKDFLRTIGFEDEEQFKVQLKEQYELHGRQRIEDVKLDHIVKKVSAVMNFPVPPGMVQHEAQHMLQHTPPGMDVSSKEGIEGYVESIKSRAEESVRFSFITEKIKEEHKLEITSDDLEKEYKKIAATHNVAVKEVRKAYMQKESSQQLKESLMKTKVMDFLKEKVKIKEV
ncbi:MAG: trigger factor [bacterium]|nr:trigger factor [bacterium]